MKIQKDEEDWYPLAAAELVEGMANNWEPGERISCRATMCVIEQVNDE